MIELLGIVLGGALLFFLIQQIELRCGQIKRRNRIQTTLNKTGVERADWRDRWNAALEKNDVEAMSELTEEAADMADRHVAEMREAMK